MSDAIDKLKSPPPAMMVPGCTTCRHSRMMHSTLYCFAIGGVFASQAYELRCKGNMWEPPPPAIPALVRFKRWLVG